MSYSVTCNTWSWCYKRRRIARVSCDLYPTHSTMLRATVLLCLVASAVVTHSLAAIDTLQDIDPINNNAPDYPIDDTIDDDDGFINNTLSAVPKCAADYPRMSIANRKMFQNGSPRPHSICVRADGYFVAAVLLANRPYVYMYDTCGWIKKKIMLPNRSPAAAGCAFTSTKLFYSFHVGKKIYQFTHDGVYEKVFATGVGFMRLTTYKNLLYATIYPTKQVRAYNTATGRLVYHFETTTAAARGLAFDPAGYLHVSTWGRVIELFTYKGFKIGQRTYPQVRIADGIRIDSNHYMIIADRGHRQVLVFTHAGLLTKRITGFSLPLDVALGYRCGYLIVADYSRGYLYLL